MEIFIRSQLLREYYKRENVKPQLAKNNRTLQNGKRSNQMCRQRKMTSQERMAVRAVSGGS